MVEMTSSAKITVIIPVYNMQSYLKEALLSLEHQKYKNFEVIIVDDGSTDNSRVIIDDFKKSSTLRIAYYYQSNKGVSAARNYGLDLCQTNLVCFLDADDTLPEYALELYARYEKEYDTVVGYTSRTNKTNENINKTHDGVDYIMNDYLFRNSKYQFCSFLYKKKILDDFSIRFSQDLKYGEDEEFTWKYLCHCKTALTIETDVYFYRDNQQSASHNVSFKRTQVIDTMIRVNSYFRMEHHPFANKLEKYGIAKAKLSILKQFSEQRMKDMYKLLVESTKYNYSMIPLLGFPDIRIKIASGLFLLSPSLFYKIVR